MSEKRQKPAAAMFPAGEDTPLLTGTPVPVDAADLTRLTAVDPAAPEGDQSLLFVTEPARFNPAAIGGNLSNGSWFVVEGRTIIGGYAYQVKTASVRGPVYPVALVTTAADAAVLAQAKELLRLVVQAYGVPASKVADPGWDDYRKDARSILKLCAQAPDPE